MTEQEKINAEVQTKLAMQDAKINVFTQEMKDFKDEMRDFKNEMRDRDNQRAEDIRRLNDKMDSIVNQIQDTWRQTMLGIGGMIIAVGALLFTALNK